MPPVDTELDQAPVSRPPGRGLGVFTWLLAALALLAFGAVGTWWWSQRGTSADAGPDLSPEALDARLLEAEQAVASLRRNQQGIDQRLVDTQARTGLLREEVLGVGQRAAILEDSLRALSAQASEGREALRLDEVELLLSLAQARLQVAGDLGGAIRATALAHEALAPLTSPQYISLRQTVAEGQPLTRETWEEMNVEFVKFFGGHKPARTAIGCTLLGIDVEMDAVARLP